MRLRVAILLAITILSFGIAIPIVAQTPYPVAQVQATHIDSSEVGETPRVIELKAFQFGFEPERISVGVGESVIFRVESLDVTHGVYIDGFDIFVEVPPRQTVDIGPIKFDVPGKYKIRCATTCGPLHPFMVADVVVEPNQPLYIFTGLTIAASTATLLYVGSGVGRRKILGIPIDGEIDLLGNLPGSIRYLLKRILQWRGLQFILILPNIFVFMVIFAAAFVGNPMGNLNFSIAVVWILWFAAVEFMILFASRLWCAMCPIPAFGEWLNRMRLSTVWSIRKLVSLNKSWPIRLDNMWILALGFLGISLIVPWLVTRPVVSGLLFLILIIVAFVIHLVYGGRYFCLNICPASGYIGHHSVASILAIRPRDESICERHVGKECIRGSPSGYGCPWKRYPGGLKCNTYCGLCTECLKSCPLENMTVKLRMIGKDIAEVGVKLKPRADEAWMGFIRLALAPFYMLVFFGPFFWIKDWGNMGVNFGANLLTVHLLMPTSAGFTNWLMWAAIVSSTTLVIFPGAFFIFSWLARRAADIKDVSSKDVFLGFSNALTPYALMLWVSFAFSLVAINWAYPLRAFSDPLGWGWDLVGTSHIKWNPLLADLIPYIQLPIVLFGLALAVDLTYKIGINMFKEHRKAIKATSIMSILYAAVALSFMLIIMG